MKIGGEQYTDGSKNEYWFLPDGIGTKFGYGVHYKKWLGVSLNSGIDWYASYKLVTVPAYMNFRLSPKIGDDTRITAQYGIGKSFALGRGNLQGTYQKFSLGLENSDGHILFIEFNGHGYKTANNLDNVLSFSLGLTLISL